MALVGQLAMSKMITLEVEDFGNHLVQSMYKCFRPHLDFMGSIICPGCCDKVPQTEWLNQQTFPCPAVLELEVSEGVSRFASFWGLWEKALSLASGHPWLMAA